MDGYNYAAILSVVSFLLKCSSIGVIVALSTLCTIGTPIEKMAIACLVFQFLSLTLDLIMFFCNAGCVFVEKKKEKLS
jgi:ABC-type amino acid transport system permease subunit